MKESEAEALRARWATRAAHGGQEREVDSQVPIGEPGTIGRLRVPRTLVVSIGWFSVPVD